MADNLGRLFHSGIVRGKKEAEKCAKFLWMVRTSATTSCRFTSLYVGYLYNGKAFNTSLSPLPSMKSRKSKVNPYSDYLRCEQRADHLVINELINESRLKRPKNANLPKVRCHCVLTASLFPECLKTILQKETSLKLT